MVRRKGKVNQVVNDTKSENQSSRTDEENPIGELKTHLVRVPNPVCFVQSLDKVRSSLQNLDFYTVELHNRITFLEEAFNQLEAVKNKESEQVYISKPKSGQEIANIFKDNHQALQKLTNEGASVIFPRKNSRQERERTEGKIEPKQKKNPNSWGQLSDSGVAESFSNSEPGSSNQPKTKLIHTKAKNKIINKTTKKTVYPPINKKKTAQVGPKVNYKTQEEQNYINFEKFMNKYIKEVGDININK